MDIILLLVEVPIIWPKRQRKGFLRQIKVMDTEVEVILNVLLYVLKRVKFLTHVETLQDGVDQIQVISQMLVEVILKKQKDIIGNLLDLINA